MENIWIAVIGLIKDVAVAVIGLFKKDKTKSIHEKNLKFDQSEKKMQNPFIPSDSDIDKVSIKDSNYFSTVGAYLASNRSAKDVIVTERKDVK